MKKIVLIISGALTFAACTRIGMTTATKVDSQLAAKTVSLDPLAVAGYWIVATNDASEAVEVYDPVVYDWNTSAALKYAWHPNASNGFTNPTDGWSNPSDARLRQIGSNQYLMVAASGGFCAAIPYPSLTGKLWANDLGGTPNPHAIELLPNGNVAIATSEGTGSAGDVRIYTASQGTYSSTYVSYILWQAHAVLWDPSINELWVAGEDPNLHISILTALIIGGTAAAPTLKEDSSRRSTLPTAWPHDVQPYYGDTNKLWVSTNGGVYIYDKTAMTFTGAPGSANRTSVKSVSNQPSGQIVETRPSVCANGWSTPQVDFYSSNATRTVTGACFYKARVFWWAYQ